MAADSEHHIAEVGNNLALVSLYLVGGGGTGLGILVFGIATAMADSAYDPSGALAWQGAGGFLVGVGVFFLAGALVAHAINWQIGRSASRS